MNKLAARGPPLPKNLKMVFKGVEVEDEGGADNGDKAMQDIYDTEGLKSSLPDGMDSEPTVIDYGEQDIIGIHDSIDTVTEQFRREIKGVTYTDGTKHHYLGQTFDFSVRGECKVFLSEYITDALEEYEVTGHHVTPASEGLFIVNHESPLLSQDRSNQFYSRVAKLLYAAIRCRPDILLVESFLTCREGTHVSP
jgi:hypothetical protein